MKAVYQVHGTADRYGGKFLFVMKVADLDDGEAIKLVRQAAQGDFDFLKLQPVGFEIPIAAYGRNTGSGKGPGK